MMNSRALQLRNNPQKVLPFEAYQAQKQIEDQKIL